MKPFRILFFVLAAMLMVALVACGGGAPPAAQQAEQAAQQVEQAAGEAVQDVEKAAEEAVAEVSEATSSTSEALGSEGAAVATEFYSQADYEAALRMRDLKPLNPDDPVWVQYLEENWVDTTQYKKDPPYTVCFSNAGVNNPWRVVGYTTMQAEVDLHPEIEKFIHVDAEGNDEKQISDIQDLVAGGNCDILIVSPNTTKALTPAVEEACKSLPVIVFDRGVQTDCPVAFVQPFGGFAGYNFGYEGAKFLVDNLPAKANVIALRILPGVDVLETRWAGARNLFAESDLNVVAVEFGDGNNDKVKTIVTDAIQKYGHIDGVWMDAGATAVAALEAFEDAGQPYPVINGEDQQDFLVKWQQEGLTAIAPTFPTFQWRTAVIAAMMTLKGERVNDPWALPQPAITQANLDQYVQPNMPPLFYAMCGCETMPDFPQRWGGTAP